MKICRAGKDSRQKVANKVHAASNAKDAAAGGRRQPQRAVVKVKDAGSLIKDGDDGRRLKLSGKAGSVKV